MNNIFTNTGNTTNDTTQNTSENTPENEMYDTLDDPKLQIEDCIKSDFEIQYHKYLYQHFHSKNMLDKNLFEINNEEINNEEINREEINREETNSLSIIVNESVIEENLISKNSIIKTNINTVGKNIFQHKRLDRKLKRFIFLEVKKGRFFSSIDDLCDRYKKILSTTVQKKESCTKKTIVNYIFNNGIIKYLHSHFKIE
jgi:hypothetical protein